MMNSDEHLNAINEDNNENVNCLDDENNEKTTPIISEIYIKDDHIYWR